MCANCHVVSLDVQFTDLQAVKQACARLGWTFCEGQTSYRWYNQWVDDSPVPRQLFETQEEYDRVCAMQKCDRQQVMNSLLGKCTHAIKVPGCRFDIGLIQRGKNLVPIWDWYDGHLRQKVGKAMEPFRQAYSVEKARLEAKRAGQMCVEKKVANGIQLRIQVRE